MPGRSWATALAQAVAIACALGVAVAVWLAAPAQAHAAALPDGVYEIRSTLGSSTCLGIRGEDPYDGGNLEIQKIRGTRGQQFYVTSVSGGYAIRPMCSYGNECYVTADGASKGSNVLQRDYGGANSQKWSLARNTDGTYTLSPRNAPSYVLDVDTSGTAEGTNVKLHTSNGTAAQRFTFVAQGSGTEVFSTQTDSTKYSALSIDTSLCNGSPAVSVAGGARYLGKDLERKGYYVDMPAGSSVTAEWSRAGAYYNRQVGVRLTASSPVWTDTIETMSEAQIEAYRKRIGSRHHIVLPNRFCDEAAFVGLSRVTYTFEFFYCDDPSRSAIDVDWGYYTCTDMDQQQNGQEWSSPVSGGGWTGGAYVAPDNRVFSASIGGVGRAWYGYVCVLGPEDGGLISVTYPWKGRSFAVVMGDTKGNFGFNMSFASLYKQTYTPVHFMVDGSAAPAYTATVPTGSTLRSSDPVMSAAKERTLKPGCSRVEGWFTGSDYAARFLTTVVTNTPVYLYGYNACDIAYYSDGSEVAVSESVRYGTAFSPAPSATAKASKPDCTAFWGWYTDPACSVPFSAPSVVTRAMKLYGRNEVTLRYSTTARSCILDADYAWFADEAMTVPADEAALYPAASSHWYGDAVGFPSGIEAYCSDAGTVRTAASGAVYPDAEASGAPLAGAALTRDTTAFVDWPWTVYDGVTAGW